MASEESVVADEEEGQIQGAREQERREIWDGRCEIRRLVARKRKRKFCEEGWQE